MNTTATPPSFTDLAGILADVSRLTEVSVEQLTSSDRASGPVTSARHLCMALVRVQAGLSLEELSTLWQRDRTSIISALYRFADRLPQEPLLARLYHDLLAGRKIRRHLLNGEHTRRLAERLANPSARSKTIPSDVVGKSTHGLIEELAEPVLRRRLIDAEEQLTYWQGAKFRAARDQDRTESGARVTLWEMQVAAIGRRLRELTRSEALTA